VTAQLAWPSRPRTASPPWHRVGVGVFARCEGAWVEHAERRCIGGAGGGLDGAGGRVASGLVIVEREDDLFDAVTVEALVEAVARVGAAEGGDGGGAVGAELVDVEDAFDEDELVERCPLAGEQCREPVGREAGSRRAAQVEILAVEFGVRIGAAGPQGADVVAPGAGDASGPAAVSRDAGLFDLLAAIAQRLERVGRSA